MGDEHLEALSAMVRAGDFQVMESREDELPLQWQGTRHAPLGEAGFLPRPDKDASTSPADDTVILSGLPVAPSKPHP